MWLELLLLILIFWLFYRSFQSGKSSLLENNPLSLLKQRLQTVAETAHMNLPKGFQVYETTGSAYTKDKNIIYIPLKRVTGQPYHTNDIMHVSLHELAHVLSPSRDVSNHGPVFLAMEEVLKRTATDLGFLDPGRAVSDEYPCAQ